MSHVEELLVVPFSHKGQTISKANCSVLNSSKKQTKLTIQNKKNVQDSFVWVLEELMTPQIVFKIYCPLVVEKHKHRTKNHDNALFYRYAILW